MTQHTSTPWTIYNKGYCSDDKRTLIGIRPDNRFDSDIAGMVVGEDADDRTNEKALADAEHIVKCVNLFPELVEALERTLAAYRDIMSSEFDFTKNPWEGRPCEVRDNAISVLAKTGG